MSEWVLIVFLVMYSDPDSMYQVPGFATRKECLDAAAVMANAWRGHDKPLMACVVRSGPRPAPKGPE